MSSQSSTLIKRVPLPTSVMSSPHDGNRIARAGYRLVLLPTRSRRCSTRSPSAMCGGTSSLVAHLSGSRPVSWFCSVGHARDVWGCLSLLVTGGSCLAGGRSRGALGGRLAGLVGVLRLLGEHETLRWLWLVPAKDLFNSLMWAVAFLGNQVRWERAAAPRPPRRAACGGGPGPGRSHRPGGDAGSRGAARRCARGRRARGSPFERGACLQRRSAGIARGPWRRPRGSKEETRGLARPNALVRSTTRSPSASPGRPKQRLDYLLDMLAFEERARRARRVSVSVRAALPSRGDVPYPRGARRTLRYVLSVL